MSQDTGHAGTQAPAVMDVFDADGDEYASLPPGGLGSSVRSFRASQGTAPDVSGDINLSNDQTTRAAAHLGRGTPDERRQDTSHNGHPSTGAEPVAAEQYDNRAAPVIVEHPEAPPARPRQGSTGADPTRVAWYRRPFLLRLFDKGIAEHPGAVLRGDQPAPRAATPRRGLGDVPEAFPYAGGHTGTQAEGVGPQRNTFRLLPRSWDTGLVSTTDPAPVENTRGRRFR